MRKRFRKSAGRWARDFPEVLAKYGHAALDEPWNQ
jgi:hypothetical protein